MTEHLEKSDRPSDRPMLETEIEITSEMMEAGIHQFWSFDERFEDAADVVKRIWSEMEAARTRAFVQKS